MSYIFTYNIVCVLFTDFFFIIKGLKLYFQFKTPYNASDLRRDLKYFKSVQVAVLLIQKLVKTQMILFGCSSLLMSHGSYKSGVKRLIYLTWGGGVMHAHSWLCFSCSCMIVCSCWLLWPETASLPSAVQLHSASFSLSSGATARLMNIW